MRPVSARNSRSGIFLAGLFLLCGAMACSRPVASGERAAFIDISGSPEQEPVEDVSPIHLKVPGGEFLITPAARYELAGMIVSKTHYGMDGWRTPVAPYDLAIVWGDLARPDKDDYISYRQSGRWYFYHWKEGTPFGEDFIIRHSSNNHIIPANSNILSAVASLRERHHVILKGYLVNVTGTYRGGDYWWHTSLTREDTGDGSCELFYVQEVVADGKIYR